MNTTRRTACIGLAAALLCGTAAAEQGVTDKEITLGISMPYSGPASTYGIVGKAAEAYFAMVNDNGGINGRKVRIVTYDDAYTPSRTIEVTRKMVEEDNVFLIFGTLGTAGNAATQKYLNAKKIPQLFIGVGADRFNDPKGNPWTVPYLPSYGGEGRMVAAQILKTMPDAKIAVISQNDDMGRDLVKGLKSGLGAKASQLVAETTYEVADPTVDSQIVTLKSSGANVFVNFGTSRAAAQGIRKVADIGWKPDQQYLWSGSNSVKSTIEPAGLDKAMGIMSIAYYKDPGQARWADDPATKAYRAFMQKYGPSLDINNAYGVYGYNVAQVIEQVIKSAGPNPTRDGVLKAATTLDKLSLPMLLPGVTMNNSSTDYFPFKTVRLVKFNGTEFEPVGEPLVDK
ncbi:MAG: branched-chain amino acid transporter substrate-binding protein [Rhizobacter sp.]|nr:branched-chain amino acid transporter substrate-binding protein [Rhizobacter sp.]